MLILMPDIDFDWSWQNFPPGEICCPHCGEIWVGPGFHKTMDQIQSAREDLGRPLHINSAHRCWWYNASPRIGGAPLSAHKKLALDVSTRGHDRHEIRDLLRRHGFSTFGLYRTFIHTDVRPGRRWYGKGGKKLWNG